MKFGEGAQAMLPTGVEVVSSDTTVGLVGKEIGIEQGVLQARQSESGFKSRRDMEMFQECDVNAILVAVIKAHNNFVATAFPIRHIRKEGESRWLKR